MYKRYVTLQDIDTTSSSNYCKIKYSIGDSNDIKIYDVNDLNSREMIINTYYYENDNYIGNYKNYHSQISSSSLENLCDSNIKTKLEIFKKYTAIFTQDFQSKCTKSEKINDSYLETCGDNKLRKWSYLYANPEEQQLYYDEDKDEDGNEIINFLIQQKYPSYQSSGFLNINYFICLLLLSFF